MNRLFLPTLLAVAALTGCAGTAGPVPPPPALVVAANTGAWQAPLPHGGRGAELAGWWRAFDDPLLPALIDAAQAASPSLASARTRIERARATLVASDAAAQPRLDGVAAAQRARSVPEAPAANSAALGAQAAWEIDLFGGIAAGQRASARRLRGAEAGWHEARVSLAADVATAYVNLRSCEAQLQQAQADAASREATARLTSQSAAAGFTAPADAALARAGAAQARSQMRAQQAQCDTLIKALVELTDRPEPALRQQLGAATARLPQAAGLANVALPAQLLQQRPDLAAASAAVEAAAADVAAARADERPRLSFAGSLQLATLRSGGVSTDGSVWSIGPLQLSLPLFDGGSRRAATAAQQAAYDEAAAQLQGSVRRALREVETALVALDATAARERDVMAASTDFEASLTATEARQRGGLASLLDLEAARRNALLARSTVIELQRERATAWIALYRSLGGGWTPAETVPAALNQNHPTPSVRP
ncbi:MAG: efflux transporter outer membrane subunit [Betaproteobacteria bacterium]